MRYIYIIEENVVLYESQRVGDLLTNHFSLNLDYVTFMTLIDLS